MILTGSQIEQAVKRRDIIIDPFNPTQLGPNSYDLRLAKHVAVYEDRILDAAVEPAIKRFDMDHNGLLLEPGKLYLMCTLETTGGDLYVPGIEGRSSVGRLGISVHATAGFGDIGFHGTWTLEVSCIQPVKIYAGMRICQVYFTKCVPVAQEDRLYRGKYYGQGLPRASGIWKEKEEWLR